MKLPLYDECPLTQTNIMEVTLSLSVPALKLTENGNTIVSYIM